MYVARKAWDASSPCLVFLNRGFHARTGAECARSPAARRAHACMVCPGKQESRPDCDILGILISGVLFGRPPPLGRSEWSFGVVLSDKVCCAVGVARRVDDEHLLYGRSCQRPPVCYTAGRVCRVRNGNEWWASQCRMMEGRDVCIDLS